MPIWGPTRFWLETKQRRVQVTNPNQAGTVAAGTSICPECQNPFGILIRLFGGTSVANMFSAPQNDAVDAMMEEGFIQTLPISPYEFLPDQSLPEKIRSAFVYIQEDAIKRRNAPGILSGARACLDVALKDLGETSGGRRDRITNLSQKGIITKAIAEWAQQLWDDGNDAIHDLDADMDRAIEHVEFLKLFFEVAFGLPSRIKQASHGQVAP